eukprot:65061-Pleurochrysis_carterae.AAC.2
MACPSSVRHACGTHALLTENPAFPASAATTSSKWGWLSRSASPLASLGTDTASHCGMSCRAALNSNRNAAAPLVAALSAAVAGPQSPTAMTAR